jgi:ribosomal protein S14
MGNHVQFIAILQDKTQYKAKQQSSCEICGSHSGIDANSSLVGCDIMA